MVPISGSAYTYAYASLGELVAWIIGWDLIIEYAVGNVAVAISGASHLRALVAQFGLEIPAWISTDYRSALQATAAVRDGAIDFGTVYLATALTEAPRVLGVPIIFNLPAVVIIVALTALLVYGIRESARANSIMVVVKVGIFRHCRSSASRLRPVLRRRWSVLPEPANYSVTCCYACGYPVTDTLWITSGIQNERATAEGIGHTRRKAGRLPGRSDARTRDQDSPRECCRAPMRSLAGHRGRW